ncbi:SMP-30/gluconolactonase/LRE family protein [Gimesia chilikensis]|jgi:sugar lactone lactonase YvrE|uniref:SMP-30/gluconolactonase/LRE family protein n=1 Tax=Gimesia chilikensis TaxID=2605989 RepID=UPI00118C984D|nr:SMP-30/gluconolactonase/LRE family protein [Gimesia chilikensis]QDT84683.1 Serine/threonine-protein kinase PknD [Gimesia chilikensis]
MSNSNLEFKCIWSSMSDNKHLLEGPALSPDGSQVYFTDCFRGTIYALDAHQPETPPKKIFSYDSLYCNGLHFLNSGKLAACVWKGLGSPRGSLQELDLGASNPPVPRIRVCHTTTNRRLKHPNDLAVDEQDGIYFTDMRRKKVYYHDPAKKQAQAIFDKLKKPNGIELEFDADTARYLYVADSGNSNVLKFEIIRPGEIRFLTESNSLPGKNAVDGLALSPAGELFVAERDEVYVMDTDLNIIDHAPLPQSVGRTIPSNICFIDEKTFVVTSYLMPTITHPTMPLKKAELFLGTIKS